MAAKTEGIDENGKLMPGYKYQGGEVVRAGTWSKYYSEEDQAPAQDKSQLIKRLLLRR